MGAVRKVTGSLCQPSALFLCARKMTDLDPTGIGGGRGHGAGGVGGATGQRGGRRRGRGRDKRRGTVEKVKGYCVDDTGKRDERCHSLSTDKVSLDRNQTWQSKICLSSLSPLTPPGSQGTGPPPSHVTLAYSSHAAPTLTPRSSASGVGAGHSAQPAKQRAEGGHGGRMKRHLHLSIHLSDLSYPWEPFSPTGLD